MDEQELGNAMEYLEKMYFRITGKRPILRFSQTKGHVVFLFREHWCSSTELDKLELLCKLSRRAIQYWPSSCPYLIPELLDFIPANEYSTVGLVWFSGYFTAAVEIAESEMELNLEDLDPEFLKLLGEE